MFLIYEVVARRKPSDKFLEYAQMAGMFILFALLIYANGNDIFRFFFKVTYVSTTRYKKPPGSLFLCDPGGFFCMNKVLFLISGCR